MSHTTRIFNRAINRSLSVTPEQERRQYVSYKLDALRVKFDLQAKQEAALDDEMSQPLPFFPCLVETLIPRGETKLA